MIYCLLHQSHTSVSQTSLTVHVYENGSMKINDVLTETVQSGTNQSF